MAAVGNTTVVYRVLALEKSTQNTLLNYNMLYITVGDFDQLRFQRRGIKSIWIPRLWDESSNNKMF